MIVRILISSIFGLFINYAFSQEEIDFSKLPEAVKTTFTKKFPDAQNVECYLNSDNNYIIVFQDSKSMVTSFLTPEGHEITTYFTINKNDLPEKIYDSFSKWNKEGWELTGIQVQTKSDTILLYFLNLMLADDVFTLIIDKNGNIKNEK